MEDSTSTLIHYLESYIRRCVCVCVGVGVYVCGCVWVCGCAHVCVCMSNIAYTYV